MFASELAASPAVDLRLRRAGLSIGLALPSFVGERRVDLLGQLSELLLAQLAAGAALLESPSRSNPRPELRLDSIPLVFSHSISRLPILWDWIGFHKARSGILTLRLEVVSMLGLQSGSSTKLSPFEVAGS